PQDTEEIAVHATGGAEPTEEAVEGIQKRMHWEYPYLRDTETPIKLSVSELTKGVDRKDYFFTRRPKLLTQKSFTPTERGIAAHKFMQFADFEKAAADPEKEIARLVEMGFLSPEEGKFVDRGTLSTFFSGSIGKRVCSADTVYREIRFMREFTPQELAEINPIFVVRGNTVVQGVADCVIIEKGEGIIVDYKTDMVTDMNTLALRYAPQLALYQHILTELLEVPITRRILYSFTLGKEITV
ncbi:MAG: PD-(D/E)XK nuclease family protein, partial [Angelakisella sp.]